MKYSWILAISLIDLVRCNQPALPEETISFPEAIEEARKTYDRCRSTLSDSYLKMIVSMARRYVGKGCHWMI